MDGLAGAGVVEYPGEVAGVGLDRGDPRIVGGGLLDQFDDDGIGIDVDDPARLRPLADDGVDAAGERDAAAELDKLSDAEVEGQPGGLAQQVLVYRQPGGDLRIGVQESGGGSPVGGEVVAAAEQRVTDPGGIRDGPDR